MRKERRGWDQGRGIEPLLRETVLFFILRVMTEKWMGLRGTYERSKAKGTCPWPHLNNLSSPATCRNAPVLSLPLSQTENHQLGGCLCKTKGRQWGRAARKLPSRYTRLLLKPRSQPPRTQTEGRPLASSAVNSPPLPQANYILLER